MSESAQMYEWRGRLYPWSIEKCGPVGPACLAALIKMIAPSEGASAEDGKKA
jgi:hypothetical protein